MTKDEMKAIRRAKKAWNMAEEEHFVNDWRSWLAVLVAFLVFTFFVWAGIGLEP